MNQPLHSTPQDVLKTYTPLLRVIVSALLEGTKHARWYADTMDEKCDRALSPALVRKGAKRYLIEKGQEATNEEETAAFEYETEYLSNLGLAMSAGAIRIRVLRSDHGHLPVPGPSRVRQSFYAQQSSFNFGPGFEALEEEDATSTCMNLVLHWSTDAEYNLDKVYLGYPKAGGTTRASVEAYWDEPIWRRFDVASSDGEQVEAEVNDLDIYLDQPATGTGE